MQPPQPAVREPGRVGAAPARQRWWSPAPDPDLEPVTARRAYTEVIGVWAAFFLAGVVGAVLLLAGRYRNPLSHASWSLYLPQALDVLIQVGLAATVVLLLAARRGVRPADLGLRLPRRDDGRVALGLLTRVFAWAVFAQVIGGIVNALLQTGHLPTSSPTAPELVFAAADSVQAGFIEEIVVLAFVVVTLRQARRPWWEVTVVALALRGSYHIYYGPGVVGILVWAALFYWLFLRTRTLVPLIVTHALWDMVGFFSQRWGVAAAIGLLVAVVLWIAGPITWLAGRNSPDRPWQPSGAGGWWSPGAASGPWETGWGRPPTVQDGSSGRPWTAPAAAPHGWYPDPSGEHHWRWWDGQRWTEHVSGS